MGSFYLQSKFHKAKEFLETIPQSTLFERNAKMESFYLQSKFHKAKECLETIPQRVRPGGKFNNSEPKDMSSAFFICSNCGHHNPYSSTAP
ncbi:hypothetical protein KSP40_PGU021018 [Platanthera guangdongensis]|uniref:Uncharacterized protein n=1 Tax=Platanthera guangdongensis TaxID=2320717 RepID=A0ABR2M8J9_9ASPA